MFNTRRAQSRPRGRRFHLVTLAGALSLLATMLLPADAEAIAPSQVDGAVVYLVNASTGRYLDADSNGSVGQSLVPKADDKWAATQVRPGVFAFRNVDDGRLLDADGPDRDHDVNLSRNLDSDTQWELSPRANGTYEIRNVEYGLWLDADDQSRGYNVDLTPQGDEADAHWYIAFANAEPEDLPGTVVLLANAATGRFLDGDANGTVDQSIAPSLDDHWLVESAGGNVMFRNMARDRLLDADEADVNLLGAPGADTEWSLTRRADGTYEIQSVEYGLWLDGDYADKNYNVDLTPNVNDRDGRWNVLVVETDSGCSTRPLDSIDFMLFCVDGADVFVHLQQFQAIADANGGIRASGTPGYDASADYVAQLLTDAGLIVERQVFDFSVFTENSSSLSADGVPIETQTLTYSGSGAIVDGTIVAVDLDLGLGNASTSGCEVEDFDGLDFSGPGDIALIQRGACNFSVKALNAAEAGAEGVIIFNQGNTEDRTGIIGATLGTGVVGILDIPVLDVAYADGLVLNDATLVSMAADTTIVTSTTENVIADLPGVNAANVAMAGAHLDSVNEGPGVQDNGTGSATLLTIALALANHETYVPQNTLRFAWWGAEEAGLVGSTEYIFNPGFGITDEEYAALAAYINFDMVGSPNFVYGVYDADESTFVASAPVPPGSAALEDLFEAYYTIRDVPYEDSEFSGRSDYQAFINVGIPASGLFTGAEGIKSDQQAAIWGGVAGEQYDECYHLACDTIDNVSVEAVEVNIDAIAYAIFNLAASTESVNGVVGVDVDGQTPADVILDGPQGTFVGATGGAIHADHAENVS